MELPEKNNRANLSKLIELSWYTVKTVTKTVKHGTQKTKEHDKHYVLK